MQNQAHQGLTVRGRVELLDQLGDKRRRRRIAAGAAFGRCALADVVLNVDGDVDRSDSAAARSSSAPTYHTAPAALPRQLAIPLPDRLVSLSVTVPPVHAASFEDLSARTFHDMVRLRVDTFIVEQGCPYPELDGRDVLPTTEHLWVEDDGGVVSYLRMYPGAEGATWIGRVVTAASHRGRGLGGLLMRSALSRAPRPVRISAQSRLAPWYAGLGFQRCGPDFLEDGMPHMPMRLDR